MRSSRRALLVGISLLCGGACILRTADRPEGPWGEERVLIDTRDPAHPNLYGGYLHPVGPRRGRAVPHGVEVALLQRVPRAGADDALTLSIVESRNVREED